MIAKRQQTIAAPGLHPELERWENEGGAHCLAPLINRTALKPRRPFPTISSRNRSSGFGRVWALASFGLFLHPDLAHTETLPRDEGGFNLVIENDLFSSNGADRNYSNGLKLSYLTPANEEPDWARALADILPTVNASVDSRFEFEIGQSMFTPKDLKRVDPDPLDRPYAGLLYGSFGLISCADDVSCDLLQIVVGVVGPSSMAGKTQRWFHHQIGGAIDPAGWASQIPNQFVVELRLQRTHRMVLLGGGVGPSLDISPHYGASVGNLTTGANLGVGFRLGWNLPVDFGPPRVFPSLPGSGYFVTDHNFGWYVFGGLDGRFVAHSLVLDERSRFGSKVERDPWVADAQLGIAAYIGNLRLAYTQVWRTPEFDQANDAISEFGAISIAWRH